MDISLIFDLVEIRTGVFTDVSDKFLKPRLRIDQITNPTSAK